MTSPFEYLWKDDPLKKAADLIHESDFRSSGRLKEIPISTSLLFLSAFFLALSRSFYNTAGFSFTQHLITSIVLVFVGYIVVGVSLVAWKPYSWVNNKLRCFLTCFIAALTASLFLIYLSPQITDVGIVIVELFTESDWIANRLPNATPAALFSALGCVTIYALKRREHGWRAKWRDLFTFGVYWLITTFILFFAAYDRGLFFDTLMRHISKIKWF